ncbi:MAG: LacI family DNA-binding transcriptional regulator [Verrucomicrobiales bacterium]|nr:LacI family DNA-binding transcriptional regulator [Verrucomicrobiales bacterium]
MKAPTMTDVARCAGVSHATVSRIINGRPGVSSRAEEAVRKAMAELQYLAPPSEQRPGRSAKPRKTRLRHHVALLTFDGALTDHSAFVASIYEGARRAARAHDFVVSLLSLDDFDTVPSWIHPDNLDGLLLHGLRSRDHLARTAAEIPSLWLTTHEDGTGDSVLPGNDAVGRIAAKFLKERGHQNVAALCIESDNPSYSVRLDSFVQSARKEKMKAASIALTKREQNLPEAADRMRCLIQKLAGLKKKDRPTGLFLPSDFMTALAHAECRRLNLRPGIDFEFVSCDNETAYLDGLYPRPATIDLGTEARGKLAFEMLFSRIQDPARDRKSTLLLDPVLVPSRD